MSPFVRFASVTIFGLLLFTVAGCNDPATTGTSLDAGAFAAQRARLTLTEEPDGVQTVADVRLALLGEPGLEHDHDGDGVPDHEPGDHNADADAHADDDADADGHEEHGDHDEHGHDDHKQASDSLDVVMVGHIGGLANPWAEVQPDFPFSKTRAVFFLADPQAIVEHEHLGHAHTDGEECAYCASHATDRADMLAMVQFVDEQGEVLPVDVRQLFDVKEKDVVVVRGKAHVTPGGTLVVDAQGLFIRK